MITFFTNLSEANSCAVKETDRNLKCRSCLSEWDSTLKSCPSWSCTFVLRVLGFFGPGSSVKTSPNKFVFSAMAKRKAFWLTIIANWNQLCLALKDKCALTCSAMYGETWLIETSGPNLTDLSGTIYMVFNKSSGCARIEAAEPRQSAAFYIFQ